MTYQDIIAEIPRLTTQERLLLLETLSRSLREDFSTPNQTIGSAERLLGSIKVDSPPDDDEVERLRYESLTEKYS